MPGLGPLPEDVSAFFKAHAVDSRKDATHHASTAAGTQFLRLADDDGTSRELANLGCSAGKNNAPVSLREFTTRTFLLHYEMFIKNSNGKTEADLMKIYQLISKRIGEVLVKEIYTNIKELHVGLYRSIEENGLYGQMCFPGVVVDEERWNSIRRRVVQSLCDDPNVTKMLSEASIINDPGVVILAKGAEGIPVPGFRLISAPPASLLSLKPLGQFGNVNVTNTGADVTIQGHERTNPPMDRDVLLQLCLKRKNQRSQGDSAMTDWSAPAEHQQKGKRTGEGGSPESSSTRDTADKGSRGGAGKPSK